MVDEWSSRLPIVENIEVAAKEVEHTIDGNGCLKGTSVGHRACGILDLLLNINTELSESLEECSFSLTDTVQLPAGDIPAQLYIKVSLKAVALLVAPPKTSAVS